MPNIIRTNVAGQLVTTYTDLQTALNAANYGDTLTLQAGQVYDGSVGNGFTFPVPQGSYSNGPVTLASDHLAKLPAKNSSQPWVGRVYPTANVYMPLIGISSASGAANNAIIWASIPTSASAPNAWTLKGIEITFTDATPRGPVQQLGEMIRCDGSTTNANAPSLTAAWQQIGPWVFDQCYIHGQNTQNVRSGIYNQSCGSLTITNSYIANIFACYVGGSGTLSECHAIAIQSGTGPINLINNYIEASGSSVFLGGGGPLYDAVPFGYYGYNTFAKNPAWFDTTPPDGIGTAYAVKNLVEFKTAMGLSATQPFIVEYNAFLYCWTGYQYGGGLVFNLINYSTTGLERLKWFVVRNNYFYRVDEPIDFICQEYGDQVNPNTTPIQTAQQLCDTMTVTNNLWLENGFYGDDPLQSSSPRRYGMELNNSISLTITNNTWVGNGVVNSGAVTMRNIFLINNVRRRLRLLRSTLTSLT